MILAFVLEMLQICRKNKKEKISCEDDIRRKSDVRQKIGQDEIMQEMKPSDASIIVHPEIHVPAGTFDISEEHKKEINEGSQSIATEKISPQIKLGRIEARVFLRGAKPKSYHSEALQRPQIASDSESRMIVADEDPRLYYTDSECFTSHSRYLQRVKPISSIS